MRLHALLAVALVAALLTSCAHRAVSAPPPPSPPAARATSSVLRGDYVGSAACARCHAKESEAWARSPMHRMTRAADASDASTPFDGRALHFKNDVITLESHDGRRFVRIARGGAQDELYRVTRIIGGRTREDFAGVRVKDAADANGESDEVVLPVSYLIFSGALRYKGYSVLLHERPFAPVGPVWSRTCIFCHNVVTRDRSGGADLVEVGIGCESCHGGGRAHVDDPATLPSFVSSFVPPASTGVGRTVVRASAAADARAQAIDRVCAGCHHVLFSAYPWTWEGGRRNGQDRGGSPINSGEGRDFLLGGCASALACTACHDPHDARDRRAKDDALATPAGNPVCTRCHAELAGDDALRAHSHHDPRGAGGACASCHMPRKNMGLDLRLTRYHRIGSPTDPERVLRDRPLECALCHADKSVVSLVTTMERWWNKAYPRDLLERLYGDLGSRTLVATLARGKPHERAVAAAALGEQHDRRDASAIASELTNEYPLVRAFAARALTDALGKDCGIEVGTKEVPQIEAEARACLASMGLAPPVFQHPAALPKIEDEVPGD